MAWERNELEITKAREMANIEPKKFSDMVQTISFDTISLRCRYVLCVYGYCMCMCAIIVCGCVVYVHL